LIVIVRFKSYIIRWISTLKLAIIFQYSNAYSRLYTSLQTKELNPRESFYQSTYFPNTNQKYFDFDNSNTKRCIILFLIQNLVLKNLGIAYLPKQ